jgi:uncharacterized protein YprB with RNaseH-like and TPR domain
MTLPISRLKKTEIVWLSKHKCKHQHTYLEHYQCYLNEKPDTQRLGFFDIETTDRKADWGVMLCYVIEAEDGTIYKNIIKLKDMRNPKVIDKHVVESCVRDMKNFDILVGFYSSRFDIKFIRTRAVVQGVPFPGYDEIKHQDIYYIVRNRFLLGRNSLLNSCKTLLGQSNKTFLDMRVWREAVMCGTQSSLDYIVDHCEHDVKDTKELYYKVINYGKNVKRSI